jgi:hypothetical protein
MKSTTLGNLRVSLSAAAVLLLTAAVAAAQPSGAPTQMNSQEFENWIAGAAGQNPSACRAAVDRLAAGRTVSDKAIRHCVELHANAGGGGSRQRAETERFIDEVLPLVTGRESLRASLLARKGSLAVGAGEFAKASEAFESAWKVIEPVRLQTDVQRQTILVSLGQSLLSQKKNEDAGRYFLLAMSYPWYTITGRPEEFQQLRDQYLLAARGLIESRRHNLKALQEITFVPATETELAPFLKKAIQEAGVQK